MLFHQEMPLSYRRVYIYIYTRVQLLNERPVNLDASLGLVSKLIEGGRRKIKITILASGALVSHLDLDFLAVVLNLDLLSAVLVTVGGRSELVDVQGNNLVRLGVGPATGSHTRSVVSSISREGLAGSS